MSARRSWRPCPVAGCWTPCKHGHLMCWPHWRRVPRLLQRGVWDTFQRYSRLATVHGAFSTEARENEVFEAKRQYDKTADEAIAAVEQKEKAQP